MAEELDLFSERVLQHGVESHEIIQCGLLNSISNSTVFDFNAVGYENRMIDMNSIFLRMTGQILKLDNSLYTDADKNAPHLVSNALSSIFSTAQVRLNNTLVANYENTYAYQAFLASILSHQEDVVSARYKKSQLIVVDHTKAHLEKVSKNSKVFELFGKLSLLQLAHYILPSVSLNIKLNLNSQEFFLMDTDPKGTGKLVILSANIYVKYLNISVPLLLATEKLLNSGRNALYIFHRPHLITASVPKGTTNLHISSLYAGLRPSLALTGKYSIKNLTHLFLIINLSKGFVTGTSFAGQRDKSPFIFTHHNLSQFSYIIDGRNVPNTPYSIKDTDKESSYYELFYNLFECLNLNDRSNLVTEDNFMTNSFLIAQVKF